MKLLGRSALVTGSSTGIGRAVAVRFAQEGANIALNYNRSAEEGAAALEECRRAHREAGVPEAKATLSQANVGREEEAAALVERAIHELGDLHVLVNNAGVQRPSPSHEMDTDAFDFVVDTNLKGAFYCARAAIRQFLSRDGGGVILNNSSVHEIIPKPDYLSYSVSKGGMQNLTRTLALEYADRGIRVNAVGPGAVSTPINDAWRHDKEKAAAVAARIPMRRVADPEEIAALFAFLASDEAAYITGQTIFACGGLTLFPAFKENWTS